mmetsp:Transcript_23449/g.92930  ORF Transcript_23449/g.92930 Transcript_23449/m.92930 type:complete len:235 (-) Transcript_23449:72-776(-)
MGADVVRDGADRREARAQERRDTRSPTDLQPERARLDSRHPRRRVHDDPRRAPPHVGTPVLGDDAAALAAARSFLATSARSSATTAARRSSVHLRSTLSLAAAGEAPLLALRSRCAAADFGSTRLTRSASVGPGGRRPCAIIEAEPSRASTTCALSRAATSPSMTSSSSSAASPPRGLPHGVSLNDRACHVAEFSASTAAKASGVVGADRRKAAGASASRASTATSSPQTRPST